MRRLAIPVLLLAACDGQDSLGSLAFKRSDESGAAPIALSASTCVLSVAASKYRPWGLYVFAEVPLDSSLIGVLEIDVPEAGEPKPDRVIYRELEGIREVFHSQAVAGQVTLLGPPRERRGEFELVFAEGKKMRTLKGSFSPPQRDLPGFDAGEVTPSSGGDVGVQVDDSGCDSTDTSSSDSDGCDGSDSGGSSSSGDSCDGSSSGGGDSCGGSDGGGAGCSGDAGGGGCSGDAHAARSYRLMTRTRTPGALALRIATWLLPYAIVGAIVQLWRRRVRRRAVALT
ncbi:MAG TPA: hypothetical protein VKN99_21740 [Polyangia bacterium]|nr:hypothetical protein [Polyangia bacterium]